MNRRTLLLGTSALGLAAFAGGAVYVTRQRAAEAEAAAAAEPPVDEAMLIRPHSPVLGPADAKVTLVEFFDPSCEPAAPRGSRRWPRTSACATRKSLATKATTR